MVLLEIQDLHVNVEDTEIIKGLNLTIREGETVALMGPNGSGKSTLAYALMGHPKYEITSGSVSFRGKDLLDLEPDERAQLGFFLSFQYPSAVPGVKVSDFLRAAYNNTHPESKLSLPKFRKRLRDEMKVLDMDSSFADRYVNEGWSGGEKKRGEILQLRMLEPALAVLDETDSGLDIDAIRIVSKGVNQVREQHPKRSFLIITHYKRILEYIQPDRVLILVDGAIVEEGGSELVDKLEEEGYDWARQSN